MKTFDPSRLVSPSPVPGTPIVPGVVRPDLARPIATRPRRRSLARLPLACVTLACASFSVPALAYVGPGAGLGVIGTLFGIVAALVLAMFGLFWYPIKRAFARRNATAEGPLAKDEPAAEETGETAEREGSERSR